MELIIKNNKSDKFYRIVFYENRFWIYNLKGDGIAMEEIDLFNVLDKYFEDNSW